MADTTFTTGTTITSEWLNDVNDAVYNGQITAEGVQYTPPFTGGVTDTVEAKLAQTVSVKDFGAVGDGVTDDTAACQSAINAVVANGGGSVYFPEGVYLLTGTSGDDSIANGLLIPFSSANGTTGKIRLYGDSKSSVLKANSDSMYVVRFSDSNGVVENLTIDGNNKSNVTGLGVVPEDTTQTTTNVWQSYNVFKGLYILNCTEGVVYKCGPTVSGSDSGCYYNELKDAHIFKCSRGILLDSGTNAGASTVNRNTFSNVRIGQSTNTGLQINAGNTNTFYSVHFEGVTSGTSPNTSPTAIKILGVDPLTGETNDSNKFYGTTCENCTVDVDNSNNYSEFYGCTFTGTKLVLTALPNVMLGGNDASQMPCIIPGYVYQTNSEIPNVSNLTANVVAVNAVGDSTLTTYQKFRHINVGTIAGGGFASVIAIPRQYRTQMCTSITIVGFDNNNIGTLSIKANVIGYWNNLVLTQYGLGDIVYASSLSMNNYTASTAYVNITAGDAGDAVIVFINNIGSNPLTNIKVLCQDFITTY